MFPAQSFGVLMMLYLKGARHLRVRVESADILSAHVRPADILSAVREIQEMHVDPGKVKSSPEPRQASKEEALRRLFGRI
jgi:hypothetical protein